jgi:hypothetical protein
LLIRPAKTSHTAGTLGAIEIDKNKKILYFWNEYQQVKDSGLYFGYFSSPNRILFYTTWLNLDQAQGKMSWFFS